MYEQAGHSSIQVTMAADGHLFPNRDKGWADKPDKRQFEHPGRTPHL